MATLVNHLQYMQVSKSNRSSKRGNKTKYDAIYDALSFLKETNYALPIFHITSNRKFHPILIEKGLIEKVRDVKNAPLSGYKATTDYYILSERGREYMKEYEKLQKVLGE